MQDVFMGTILPFGFSFAPVGFQTCQGQILSIAQNTALFSLLGTVYGGNGSQTFGLPDLRGRTLIGEGQGPGLQNYVLGQFGGTEQVSLLSTQMPMHTHIATFTPTGGGGGGITATLKASTMVGTQSVAGTSGATTLAASTVSISRVATAVQSYVADPAPSVTLAGLSVTGGGGITGGTVTNAPAGGNLPFPILSPYLTINYCIATLGVYPSRN